MSLILNGRREETPFRSLSWWDLPDLRLSTPEDGRLRPPGTEIRATVWHSTKGWPDRAHPDKAQRAVRGTGPGGSARRTFAFWRDSATHAGAHVTVDGDGTVCQGADLLSEMAFHAGDRRVNEVSVGIEVWQGPDGQFWESQLDGVADFGLWLHQRLGLPLRACFGYPRTGGAPVPGISALRGAYGHRDCSEDRGWGDPGDLVFERLRDRAGFALMDFRALLPGQRPPA